MTLYKVAQQIINMAIFAPSKKELLWINCFLNHGRISLLVTSKSIITINKAKYTRNNNMAFACISPKFERNKFPKIVPKNKEKTLNPKRPRRKKIKGNKKENEGTVMFLSKVFHF